MTYISDKIPEIIKNIFDADMGYWTEVDVPGRVTIDYANERIVITDLDNDEDVYIYKATDANVGDFILDFEFQVLSTSVNQSKFAIGLADSIGTQKDASNGLYAHFVHTNVDDNGVRMQHLTGGSIIESVNITSLADDTLYYGCLIRRGSYCLLSIYSDRIRETHVTGSPVELKDTTPVVFTHLYPMSAFDDGTTGKAMDAYVESIKLISAPDIDKYLEDRSGTNTTLDDVKTQTDKLAGAAPTVGSTVANYNAAEQDIVSIGTNDTKNKLHLLLLDINALTAAATVTIRMYMQVNGTERKVYDADFVKGTDPDGVWIVTGTVGIHEVLRVAAQSDNASDDGKAIGYDYMVEGM